MGERRNFVQWAKSMGKNPNYLVLFEEILGQETYNEDEIKKKHPGYAQHSNFSEKKKELFNAILRSLREVGVGKSKPITVEIEEITLLIGRYQFQKSITKIGLAKRKAIESEKFDETLILLRLEKRCLKVFEQPNPFQILVYQINKEIQRVKQLRENLEEYESVFETDFYILNNAFNSGRVFDQNLVSNIESNPLFLNPEHALSIRAKVIFFTVGITLKRARQNFKEARDYSNQLIKLFESNPFLAKEYFDDYLRNLFVNANLQFLTGNIPAGMDASLKIKRVNPANKTLKVRSISTYFLAVLPASNEAIIPRIEEQEIKEFASVLEKYRHYYSKERLLGNYFLIGLHYFWQANYRTARTYFEKITLHNWGNAYLKRQGVSKVLGLVCYCLTKEEDLFDLHYEPTVRYLFRNEIFTQVSIPFLRELKKGIDLKQEPVVSLSDVEEIRNKEPEVFANFSNYFNLTRWAKMITTDHHQL
ncbi:MAG: hypothetical protein H6581_16710 [Bacteroidia bacterium]|nr:hypothetical protein [Bacteroidia bacterium]